MHVCCKSESLEFLFVDIQPGASFKKDHFGKGHLQIHYTDKQAIGESDLRY